VREVRVIKDLVPAVVQALATDSEDMATGMLPSLSSLDLGKFRESPSLVEAAEQFVAMRELSGRSIHLYG
jgi:hypothetical protein